MNRKFYNLATTTSRNAFSGNGVTTAFALDYAFINASSLVVTLRTAAGVETVQTLNTHYTASGGLNASGVPDVGTVTMVTAPASGASLIVDRVEPYVQSSTFQRFGAIPIKVVELMVDRVTLLCQQLLDLSNRTLRYPSSEPLATSGTLPAKSARLGKILAFDATTGAPVVSTATLATIESGAPAAASSATAAAASATSASTSATSAATSATAAQAAADSVIWNDVVFKTTADSPISIAAADRGKMFVIDATAGAVTVNLPQISTLSLADPYVLGFKKSDSSANAVTINRAATDTIDGAASKALTSQNVGTALIPDIDPAPDIWTAADFGPSSLNITGLTAETAPATDDELPAYDTSAAANRKFTWANALKVINGLTEDTTPDTAADFVLAYDTSAAAVKKVKPANLGSGGSRTLIATLTASASATLDFTAFNSSLYDDYEFDLSGIYPSVDDADLWVRVSLDGGSSYRSTAGDYSWSANIQTLGSNIGTGVASDTKIVISSLSAANGLSNVASETFGGLLHLRNPAAGNHPVLQGSLAYTRSNDLSMCAGVAGGAFIGTTGAVNGMRFMMDTGNITAGKIRVYGVKK